MLIKKRVIIGTRDLARGNDRQKVEPTRYWKGLLIKSGMRYSFSTRNTINF